MGNDNTRFIPAFILILMGVGLYYLSTQPVLTPVCTNFSWIINPLCWGIAGLVNSLMSSVYFISALVFAFMGVIYMMLETPQQRGWFVGFFVVALLTVFNWVIPDPIPYIDELGLSLLTIFFGIKTLIPGKISNNSIF